MGTAEGYSAQLAGIRGDDGSCEHGQFPGIALASGTVGDGADWRGFLCGCIDTVPSGEFRVYLEHAEACPFQN